MKRCPYCASKLHDAMIICHYCGRHLELAGTPKAREINQPMALVSSSTWIAGAKGAAVLTVLAGVGLVMNSHGRLELAGNLLLGIPVAYLFLWAICVLLVWLWRKLGALPFLALLFISAVLVLVSILIASGTAGTVF